jgi:cytochrome c oxidase assembly protein subunit 11
MDAADRCGMRPDAAQERAGDAARVRANRRLSRKLAVVAVAMFGFGFALVPFYERICVALGIYQLDAPDATAKNTQVDRSRTVTIEFDSNTHDLPWRFRPLTAHLSVHPGELATVEYEVVNVRDTAVTGQAVPSYGPSRAAEFFKKVDCFCFTQQTLAPRETRRMPVVFVVDPKLPASVNTITLSYTFFEVAGRGGRT